MCFVRPDLMTSVNYLFCNSLESVVGIVLRISVKFVVVLRVSVSETNKMKLLKLFIMAGMNRRLGGNFINGQRREIISNVFTFMKKEADDKEVTIPVVTARGELLLLLEFLNVW